MKSSRHAFVDMQSTGNAFQTNLQMKSRVTKDIA